MIRRVLFALVLVAAWIGLLGWRLYALQVEHHGHYVELAERQQQREVNLIPPRGTVYDARGRELAVSVAADSVFAVPRRVEDPAATAKALAEVLEMNARELTKKLTGDGWFVWIKRQLDAPQAAAVKRLALPGIGLKEESKRYYPQRQLAAHVLGFVGTDSRGLAGLEQEYDEVVAGKAGRRVMLRDAGGRLALDPELGWTEPEPGADLYLTLDSTLQYLAERELARTIEERGAKAGSVALLDPATGAVLALASWPTFDPNHFGRYDDRQERWRNRAVTDVFEPGSVFKMVTAAAALEGNLVDPSDVFDCELGAIQLFGTTIRDHKPFGLLTFREVIARSSNVGAIKVGLKVGDVGLYNQIRRLGFGDRTGIDLPGEGAGLLRPLTAWQPITKAYISFGQGIAVTSLQLAAAYAAVANGGTPVAPHLVAAVGRDGERQPVAQQAAQASEPAMSPATARTVERLLEAVVADGTGTKAAVEGYRVAGKTGTAQMVPEGGRGYSATDHMAVFVGFAPARRPALVGAIVIDRPRGDYHGGSVAAPVFAAIARPALLYLGVRPEREAPEAWPLAVAEVAPPAQPPAGAVAPAASHPDLHRPPRPRGEAAERGPATE